MEKSNYRTHISIRNELINLKIQELLIKLDSRTVNQIQETLSKETRKEGDFNKHYTYTTEHTSGTLNALTSILLRLEYHYQEKFLATIKTTLAVDPLTYKRNDRD